MASPTGIIPEDWFYPAQMGKVMDWLKALPVPGHEKMVIFQGWGRWVGMKLSPSQLNAIIRSGVDQ